MRLEQFKVQELAPDVIRGSRFTLRDAAQDAAPQGERPKENPEPCPEQRRRIGTRNPEQQRNAVKRPPSVWQVIAGVILLSSLGCGKSEQPQARLPEVQVVQVEQKDVPIPNEWVGTLEGGGQRAD